MATYKYSKFVQESGSEEFDKAYGPGLKTPVAGIYRCEGCGLEVVLNVSDLFPSRSRHRHADRQGTICWRLIVCADGR